ncbi:MAG: alpha/beta fold hydrolase [Holosporales bacterium]
MLKRNWLLGLIISLILPASWLQATQINKVTTSDGMKVRVAYKKATSGKADATLVLLQGRASFIEKHNELIGDLTQMGYDVWTFDWRGQGGSDRLLDHPQKNHIENFDHYLQDMHEIMQQVVKPKTNKPIVLLGQSLGGHLALRYAYAYPEDVQGVILAAPMMDVVTKPFPKPLARWIVGSLTALGYGDAYAPGYGDFVPGRSKFENNTTTNDYARWHRQQALCEKNMHLTCGGPTNAWVHAAMQSMDFLNRPEVLSAIKVPVLWVTAGQDRVVDTHQDAELCRLMQNCRQVTFDSSRHNILMEVDEVRGAFLKEIKNFKDHVTPAQSIQAQQ